MENVQRAGETKLVMNSLYQFQIKNIKAKQFRLLANLILCLNGFVFMYAGIYANNKSTIIIGAITVSMAVVAVLYQKNWIIHNSMVVPVFIGWLNVGYWWVGIVMWPISLLAQIASNDKKIEFNSKEIKLASPFGKIFIWQELQNIVLKDGLLTLDFKNNKLLQTPILNELTEAETKQFNDFCNQQLATSN